MPSCLFNHTLNKTDYVRSFQSLHILRAQCNSRLRGRDADFQLTFHFLISQPTTPQGLLTKPDHLHCCCRCRNVLWTDHGGCSAISVHSCQLCSVPTDQHWTLSARTPYGHVLMIWVIVCTSPQSQSSLSVEPHLLWQALQWPWSVLNWFSDDYWSRGSRGLIAYITRHLWKWTVLVVRSLAFSETVMVLVLYS